LTTNLAGAPTWKNSKMNVYQEWKSLKYSVTRHGDLRPKAFSESTNLSFSR
jgi:hypothetical protein